MNERAKKCTNEFTIEWINVQMNLRFNEYMCKWMSKWTYKWMNLQKNLLMNEQMNFQNEWYNSPDQDQKVRERPKQHLFLELKNLQSRNLFSGFPAVYRSNKSIEIPKIEIRFQLITNKVSAA